MKIKIMQKILRFSKGIFSKKLAFCNIAEGTHAGNLTMTAGENIDTANLVVTLGALPNEILIAGATSKPIGICNDEASFGEPINVELGGCAESTIICHCAVNVNSGDYLYTASAGKVSNIATAGSYKIGIALHNANAGCPVEVDPQGFGNSAYKMSACGIYEWKGSETSEALQLDCVKSSDIVVAGIQESSTNVNSVKAKTSNGEINFTLNATGTAGMEKISWIVISKN